MRIHPKILISLLALLIYATVLPFSITADEQPSSKLNLSQEQVIQLIDIIREYGIRQTEIDHRINIETSLLEEEIRNIDSFKSDSEIADRKRKVNGLIRKLSSLYGDLMRINVEKLIKSKDLLSREQQDLVLRRMHDFEPEYPDQMELYLQLGEPTLLIGLSGDQLKRILKHRSQMEISQSKLQLALNLDIIDIQEQIFSGNIDSDIVNKKIRSIAEINIKMFTNSIEYILNVKDVLTIDQLRLMYQLMLSTVD